MENKHDRITDIKPTVIGSLQQMQEPIDYFEEERTHPAPVSLLHRIPFLSRFIKNAGELGNEVMQLGASVTTFRQSVPDSVLSGFQFGAVALAALDFILIPIVYLSAFILNQKVPISLNNNARWMFSSILLGLTLTAVLVPVTAPIIALVTAGLTLGLSSFLLGKSLYERYQLAKEHKVIRVLMDSAEDEMQRIQDDAKYLESALNGVDDADEAFLAELYNESQVLQERYAAQKKLITELKIKEAEIKEQIKKVDIIHVTDKAVAVAFAAIAVVGFVVALFIPPVGLGILAGVSVASMAYITVRIAKPLFKSLGSWFKNTLQKTTEIEEEQEQQDGVQHEKGLDEQGLAENSQNVIQPPQRGPEKTGSTDTILERLAADEAAVSTRPSEIVGLDLDDESLDSDLEVHHVSKQEAHAEEGEGEGEQRRDEKELAEEVDDPDTESRGLHS